MFRYVLRSIAAETSDGDLAARLMEIHNQNLPGLSLPALEARQRCEIERIIRDRLVARAGQELAANTQNRAEVVDTVRGLADLLASVAAE